MRADTEKLVLASEFRQWLNPEDAPAVVQHVKDRTAQDAQRVLTAVLLEDADVDADVDDDDAGDVVVVTPKMTVPCLAHGRTGVRSAVDALEVVVAHDANLASAALQNSEFVIEVASVEQSVRRNMRKLQARLNTVSRQHACQQTINGVQAL